MADTTKENTNEYKLTPPAKTLDTNNKQYPLPSRIENLESKNLPYSKMSKKGSLMNLFGSKSSPSKENKGLTNSYFNIKKEQPEDSEEIKLTTKSVTTPYTTRDINSLKFEDLPWLDENNQPQQAVEQEEDKETENKVLSDKTDKGSMGVVGKKKNMDFHQLFPNIQLDEFLLNDWLCSYKKDILISGRLYVTKKWILFYSNIFGWITNISIPIEDIIAIEKKSTAYFISNAIQISTINKKSIWMELCPNRANATKDKGADNLGGKNTYCVCYNEGVHEGDVHLESVYQTNVETMFGLIFGEEATIFQELYQEDKCTEIEIGSFEANTNDNTTRKTSFVKPINNPIGPKQTKCYISEEITNKEFENYCSVKTSVVTPDVPSGSSFTICVRYCLMVYNTNMTRLIVSSKIEWSKSSWLKSAIESASKEANEQNAKKMDVKIKEYLNNHPELITNDEVVVIEETISKRSKSSNQIYKFFKNIKIELSSLFTVMFMISIVAMIVKNLVDWSKIRKLKKKVNKKVYAEPIMEKTKENAYRSEDNSILLFNEINRNLIDIKNILKEIRSNNKNSF